MTTYLLKFDDVRRRIDSDDYADTPENQLLDTIGRLNEQLRRKYQIVLPRKLANDIDYTRLMSDDPPDYSTVEPRSGKYSGKRTVSMKQQIISELYNIVMKNRKFQEHLLAESDDQFDNDSDEYDPLEEEEWGQKFKPLQCIHMHIKTCREN
tara:strand:- start:1398 stop:1853 length:456 start_codon:yes stop_codon:yes gene_type:complete